MCSGITKRPIGIRPHHGFVTCHGFLPLCAWHLISKCFFVSIRWHSVPCVAFVWKLMNAVMFGMERVHFLEYHRTRALHGLHVVMFFMVFCSWYRVCDCTSFN